MGNSNVLVKRIYKDTGTLALMDEFEELDENLAKKYDVLKLVDVFKIEYRRNYYWVSLNIERAPWGLPVINSDLTFTEFKKGLLEHFFRIEQKNNYKVLTEIFSGLSTLSKSGIDNKDEMNFRFPKPVQFNAQNSGNRCGYGNIYRGEELVREGTLYGETTKYMFVSSDFRRW